MPLGKCNPIMAKATSLIFSLFNIASAGHVPFDIPQYHSMYGAFFMDLLASFFVSHLSFLTAKGVNLVVGFPS